MFQLVAANQPSRVNSRSTSTRSWSGSRPLNGETSRISMTVDPDPSSHGGDRRRRHLGSDLSSAGRCPVDAARDAAADLLQVSEEPRPPVHEGLPGEVAGESPMRHPRPPLRVRQIGLNRAPHDLQSEPHPGQQPVELVIAEVDLAGDELADARLAHPLSRDSSDWVVLVSSITLCSTSLRLVMRTLIAKVL